MSFEIVNGGYLEFKLSNNFNPNINEENKHGIGISNTERRLKLLFATDFSLETKTHESMYNLFLKIPVR
jgi:LytS/YehU family sensor histidine kinase